MTERPDGLNQKDVKVSISDYFANERTYLAWLRTGIATIGLGFVVARFGLVLKALTGISISEATFDLSSVLGIILVAAGELMVLLSFKRFAGNQARIRAGSYEPSSGAELAISTVIFVVALLLIADLLLTL